MNGLKNNLLIHAVPGARSGLVAAWLNGHLTKPSFDVGAEISHNFIKVHWMTEQNKKICSQFNGIRIKIDFDIDDLSSIGVLFLRKTVYSQQPDYNRDEFSLEVYTKIVEFLKGCLKAEEDNKNLDLYDYRISFKDTFNLDCLIKLYQSVNGIMPTADMIESLVKTNQNNQIDLDRNHACSIAQLTLSREYTLGLLEKDRFWSIVDVYQSTPTNDIHETVFNLINRDNYGTLLK